MVKATIREKQSKGGYSERGTGRLYKRGRDGKEYSAGDPHLGNYYLEYRVNGKRTRQRLLDKTGAPITNKAEAEKERTRITAPFVTADKTEQLQAIKAKLAFAEQEHAKALDLSTPPLSIAETWEQYLQSNERPDSGERTLKDYRSYWSRFEKWLKTANDQVEYLCDVNDAVAKEYASDLVANKVSPNTFNKHIGFLKLLFRVLEVPARMKENPFGRICKKKLKTNVRRELTIAELRIILDAASGEVRTLLYLGTFTGLRLGDCATLKWGEVDMDRGVIKRIPNKTSSRSAKPVLVGIPPALYAQLASTAKSRRRRYVLPKLAEQYAVDPAVITKQVQKLFEDCGIQTHREGTGYKLEPIPGKDGRFRRVHTGKRAVVEVGFHSLRHTYVSLQAQRGTPLAVVQAVVGHGSPAMTAHYTHIGEEAALQAARALGSGIADAEFEEVKEVPGWIREKLATMTAKNWRKIREELL